MTNLTVAILSHNESDNLAKLLPTLGFANEVIVVNDNSTDNTKKVVSQNKAKLLNNRLNADFAKQRNFALENSHNDWVMFVDADERLSPELKKYFEDFEPDKNISGYSFRRIDWFYNKQLRFGETGRTMVTRLVNRKLGQFTRPVHETWTSNFPVKKTNLLLYHYPHPSVSEFIKHINYYSTINADYLKKMGKKPSILGMMFVPLFKFIYTYFVLVGFLDGTRGFVYSFMMSFHSFLTRSKLYALYQ